MFGLITAVAPLISDVLKRTIEDKDLAHKLETEIQAQLIRNASDLQKAATDIVLAEAKSEHWLVSSWRPILMLVISTIVAVHYLFFPLVNLFFKTELQIDLPQELWTLLQIGVGGYVVGRSVEKTVGKWKK